MRNVTLTECPRDAMQGLASFVPTSKKAELIWAIERAGFPVIDALSFVSPKAVPQMADSAAVVKALGKGFPHGKLLAIVANLRGAEEALQHPQIAYLGFPLSVSETFQQRNTRKSIAQALEVVEQIKTGTHKAGKKLVVYLSMAFGNPYGEAFAVEQVIALGKKLEELGVHRIALSDTIGSATTALIEEVYAQAKQAMDVPELALHLHSLPDQVADKTTESLRAGCSFLDTALLGFGGCPMAKDDLTGNMDTLKVVDSIEKAGYTHGLDKEALHKAARLAQEVFLV